MFPSRATILKKAPSAHAPVAGQTRKGLWQTLGVALALVLLVYLHQAPLNAQGQGAVAAVEYGLLAAWIIGRARRGLGLPRTPIDGPLAALLLVGALSTVLSPTPRLGVEQLVLWLRMAFAFYALVSLLDAGWPHDVIVNALLLVGAVMLCDALNDVGGWLFERWRLRADGYPLLPTTLRIFGVAAHPNQLAAVVYLLLPFAIVRLWQARAPLPRAAWALWLLAADVVLFFTGSRAGWLGAGVGLGVCVTLLLCHAAPPTLATLPGWLRARWRTLSTTAAYLLLFGLLLLTQASQLATNRGGITHDSGRQQFWQSALDQLAQRPLLGGGLGTYALHYAATAPGTYSFVALYAHNWLLNTAAQLGLFGALALVALVVLGALALVSAVVRGPSAQTQVGRPMLYACCAGWSALLVQGIFDMPFSTALLFAMCAAALGVRLAQGRFTTETQRHRGAKDATASEDGQRGGHRFRRWRALVPAALCLLLGCMWWCGVTPALADDTYGDARAAAARGDWRAALALTEQAQARDPELGFYEGQRAYALAMLAQKGGDAEAARAAYARDALAEPGYVTAQLNYAALLLEAHDTGHAQALLEQMVARDAPWPLVQLMLARAYEQAGAVEQARQHFALMVQFDPAYRHTLGCAESALCNALPKTQPAAPVGLEDLKAQALGWEQPDRWMPLIEAHLARGELPQARYALTATSEPTRFAAPGLRERYGLATATYFERTGRPDAALRSLQSIAAPPADTQSYSLMYSKASLSDPLLPEVARLLDTPERVTVYAEIARLAAAQNDKALAGEASAFAKTLAARLAR